MSTKNEMVSQNENQVLSDNQTVGYVNYFSNETLSLKGFWKTHITIPSKLILSFIIVKFNKFLNFKMNLVELNVCHLDLTSNLIDFIQKEASDCFSDVKICENFHISISKTFCIKKHKIELINNEIEKSFKDTPK